MKLRRLFELAAHAHAEAVVDQDGDLRSAGADGDEAGEIGLAVIDLDGEVV